MKYITEEQVLENLKMEEVIDAVRDAFTEYAEGRASFSPRDRLRSKGILLNTMPAVLDKSHIAGLKSYIAGRNGAKFVVIVFDTEKFELKGVVEANRLGQMRTGAVPAIVTSMLTDRKEIDFALLGTGYQAETQLEAMAALFKLRSVRVFSRNPDHVREFASRFSEKFSLDIQGVHSAEECVRNAEVISTITDSSEPLFGPGPLGENFHINLAGGNLPARKEVGNDVLDKAELVVVEDMRQALNESGEIIDFYEQGAGRIIELSDLMREPAKYSGFKRTVFKSMGVGLEDIATADILLNRL